MLTFAIAFLIAFAAIRLLAADRAGAVDRRGVTLEEPQKKEPRKPGFFCVELGRLHGRGLVPIKGRAPQK
jgi:hypothetical protein